jgi:hypothetical protein
MRGHNGPPTTRSTCLYIRSDDQIIIIITMSGVRTKRIVSHFDKAQQLGDVMRIIRQTLTGRHCCGLRRKSSYKKRVPIKESAKFAHYVLARLCCISLRCASAHGRLVVASRLAKTCPAANDLIGSDVCDARGRRRPLAPSTPIRIRTRLAAVCPSFDSVDKFHSIARTRCSIEVESARQARRRYVDSMHNIGRRAR